MAKNHLRLQPGHLVPIQTGKVLVNKREAGFDPKEDEALGITEKDPGFRKNSN